VAVWLGLIVALVGLLQTGTPARGAVLSLIVVAATLAVSLRWRIGAVAVIVLLGVGIALRVVPSSGFSDVLIVTEAAIREMLAGGNPYGHGYEESFPPGAPFASMSHAAWNWRPRSWCSSPWPFVGGPWVWPYTR